jgi:hypothetical protein
MSRRSRGKTDFVAVEHHKPGPAMAGEAGFAEMVAL